MAKLVNALQAMIKPPVLYIQTIRNRLTLENHFEGRQIALSSIKALCFAELSGSPKPIGFVFPSQCLS